MGAASPACFSENACEAAALQKAKEEADADTGMKFEADTAVFTRPPAPQPEAEPDMPQAEPAGEEEAPAEQEENARLQEGEETLSRVVSIEEAAEMAEARKDGTIEASKSEPEGPVEPVTKEPAPEEKPAEAPITPGTSKDKSSSKKKATKSTNELKPKKKPTEDAEEKPADTSDKVAEKKTVKKKASAKKSAAKEKAGEASATEAEDDKPAAPADKPATMTREELKKIEQEWKKRPAKEQEQLGKQLREAAKSGNAAEVTNLLSSGVWPNAADKDGWTPLMKAAEVGQKNAVEVLLQNGADAKCVLKLGEWGCSALHFAARNNHREVAELLAEKSDLKGKNYVGKTAAETAKQEGHSDLAKMLKGKAKKQG